VLPRDPLSPDAMPADWNAATVQSATVPA